MSETVSSRFGGVLLTVVERRELFGPGTLGAVTACAGSWPRWQLLAGALLLRCRRDHAPGGHHGREEAQYERGAETLTNEQDERNHHARDPSDRLPVMA